MKTTAYVGVILLLVGVGIPVAGHAQTNSWSSPTRGYWDDYEKWSLGVTPTNSQSVYITNDVSKTVTIDSYTSEDRPDTMTVSNLSLFAPLGVTNTLELFEAGTNLPLYVQGTFSLSAGGVLDLTDSALWMQSFTNSITLTMTNIVTNGVLSVDGTVVLNSDGLLMADSGLYVGVDTNATGLVVLNGGQLFLTNGASSIGVNGSGQVIISNGAVQASAYVLVGSGSGSQGALTVAGGSYLSSPYSRLAVGMETGAVGVVSVTAGNLVMTNAFLTLVGGDGSGQLNLFGGTNILGPVEVGGDSGSQGTLTVAGGVNDIQGALLVGASIGATGAVWMTGGQLLTTNWPTYVGSWGYGVVTVSNGNWHGGSMVAGVNSNALGTVNLVGGSVTLLSKLVIGNCASGGVGVVNVAGSSLYVTNAAHNAFIDVRRGQLNISGGVLVVDRFIMTNDCAQFVRTGGTLTYGQAVLDPSGDADGDGLPNGWEQSYGLDPLNAADANIDSDGDGFTNLQEYQAGTNPTNSASAFRIIEVRPDGDDMLITWTAVGGKWYVLQTTTGYSGGFSNDFVDLGLAYVAPGTGETVMSVLHLGAAVGAPARFYRVRLVP